MSPPGQLTPPPRPIPGPSPLALPLTSRGDNIREALEAIEARLDYDAAHRYVHGDIFKAGVPKCTDADYFEKGNDRNFQLVNTAAAAHSPLNLGVGLSERGVIGQGLPRHGEHFVREIWANPIIEQVAASLLSGDCCTPQTPCHLSANLRRPAAFCLPGRTLARRRAMPASS